MTTIYFWLGFISGLMVAQVVFWITNLASPSRSSYGAYHVEGMKAARALDEEVRRSLTPPHH